MTRTEAIKIISDQLDGNYPLVTSTGLMSRELFCYRDADSHFYMVGSMGLAAAIGLGLAINLPAQNKVVVLEGDASFLMGLNNLANIALRQPANMIHLVLDNNAYASCSEEPTASHKIDWQGLVRAAGYRQVLTVTNESGLINALEESLVVTGPTFIYIKIALGGRRDLPRPLDLPAIARRFKNFIIQYEKHHSK